MDRPARVLGSKHRRERHPDVDPGSMILAGLIFGERETPERIFEAMIIHTIRDRIQTEWDRTLNKWFKERFTRK